MQICKLVWVEIRHYKYHSPDKTFVEKTELCTRIVFAALQNLVSAGISHVIDVATEEKQKLVILRPLDKI